MVCLAACATGATDGRWVGVALRLCPTRAQLGPALFAPSRGPAQRATAAGLTADPPRRLQTLRPCLPPRLACLPPLAARQSWTPLRRAPPSWGAPRSWQPCAAGPRPRVPQPTPKRLPLPQGRPSRARRHPTLPRHALLLPLSQAVWTCAEGGAGEAGARGRVLREALVRAVWPWPRIHAA